MKKKVAILFLVTYGLTSIGATIHMHYCMNEFVGWNLWHSEKDKKCSKCGMMENKGGCCKDEHKQIKISADQNNNQVKALILEQFFNQAILTHSYKHSFTKPATVAVTLPKNNAPPNRWQNVPLYLSNSVFLI